MYIKHMDWVTLISCIALSFLPGIIGSVLMGDSAKQTWYVNNKPPLTPPPIVFPIVWNILYLLLGIALYMVYTARDENRTFVLTLLVVNLVLNGLWTALFFVQRNYVLAYVDIMMMLLVSVIAIFHAESRSAKWLMMPYVFWIGFASTLNLHFVLLKWNGTKGV